MPVKIITVPFDPELELFRDEDPSSFLVNKTIKKVVPQFFSLHGKAWWSVFVDYEPVLRPEEKGEERGLSKIQKEHLRIKAYVRYMDDFVICLNSSAELCRVRDDLGRYLEEKLDLEYKPGGVFIQPVPQGCSFLGMRIYPRLIRVRGKNRQRSLRRLRHRIRQWEAGYCSDERLGQCLASIAGRLKYFNFRHPVFPL